MMAGIGAVRSAIEADVGRAGVVVVESVEHATQTQRSHQHHQHGDDNREP